MPERFPLEVSVTFQTGQRLPLKVSVTEPALRFRLWVDVAEPQKIGGIVVSVPPELDP